MEIVERKISEIKEYEKNPRKNDGAVDSVASSIKEFGFKVPIVIDADGVIVCGHTRVKAAKKLGMATVPCIIADDLTPEQIKAFRLADNKVSELAEWDFDFLDDELAEIENIDMEQFGFVDVEDEISQDEYERRKQDFKNRMEAGELSEDDDEYQEFLAKFEPKKTTDDCYTPPLVYEAVADYVSERYEIAKSTFVRPFVPNGDYKKFSYKESDTVVDNPPFSIISEICKWYNDNNIRFFLFAPHLTCLGIRAAQKIVIGVNVTYENGAVVCTSFVTNMENAEIMSSPKLYALVKEADEKTKKETKKELPKYDFPIEVCTSSNLARFSKYGVEFSVCKKSCVRISGLDEMKKNGKEIFGSAYLVSEKAAAEKAAAEKAAARVWKLSEREKKVIASLGRN